MHNSDLESDGCENKDESFLPLLVSLFLVYVKYSIFYEFLKHCTLRSIGQSVAEVFCRREIRPWFEMAWISLSVNSTGLKIALSDS